MNDTIITNLMRVNTNYHLFMILLMMKIYKNYLLAMIVTFFDCYASIHKLYACLLDTFLAKQSK